MSRQDVKDGAKVLGGGFLITLVIVLGAILIGGIIWGISVATSDVRGQGDAVRQINSGTNRIEQYDHFFKLDADIRSQAQNAANAKAQLDAFNKTTPPSSTESFSITESRNNLQSAYTGMTQICVSNVNKYNNDSASYTMAKFKDSGLPWNYNTNVCTNPDSLPAAPQP